MFGSVMRLVVVTGAETNVSSHDSAASQMKAVVGSCELQKPCKEDQGKVQYMQEQCS